MEHEPVTTARDFLFTGGPPGPVALVGGGPPCPSGDHLFLLALHNNARTKNARAAIRLVATTNAARYRSIVPLRGSTFHVRRSTGSGERFSAELEGHSLGRARAGTQCSHFRSRLFRTFPETVAAPKFLSRPREGPLPVTTHTTTEGQVMGEQFPRYHCGASASMGDPNITMCNLQCSVQLNVYREPSPPPNNTRSKPIRCPLYVMPFRSLD